MSEKKFLTYKDLQQFDKKYEALEKKNKELKLTIAKILDNRLEDDKLYLIIDHVFKMSPGDYIKQYKKELGYE